MNGQSGQIWLTPRTEDDAAALLRERPSYWEYLYYAGRLSMLLETSENQELYRDHLLRFASLTGPALDVPAATARLRSAFPDVIAQVAILMEMFAVDAQKRAFGAPGHDGDSDLIDHLAVRTVDCYRAMIRWGSDLRSARCPTEFRAAFNLASEMMRGPVEQFRGYVTTFREKLDSAMVALAEPDFESPLAIEVVMLLTVDNAVQESFLTELERLTQELFAVETFG